MATAPFPHRHIALSGAFLVAVMVSVLSVTGERMLTAQVDGCDLRSVGGNFYEPDPFIHDFGRDGNNNLRTSIDCEEHIFVVQDGAETLLVPHEEMVAANGLIVKNGARAIEVYPGTALANAKIALDIISISGVRQRFIFQYVPRPVPGGFPPPLMASGENVELNVFLNSLAVQLADGSTWRDVDDVAEDIHGLDFTNGDSGVLVMTVRPGATPGLRRVRINGVERTFTIGPRECQVVDFPRELSSGETAIVRLVGDCEPVTVPAPSGGSNDVGSTADAAVMGDGFTVARLSEPSGLPKETEIRLTIAEDAVVGRSREIIIGRATHPLAVTIEPCEIYGYDDRGFEAFRSTSERQATLTVGGEPKDVHLGPGCDLRSVIIVLNPGPGAVRTMLESAGEGPCTGPASDRTIDGLRFCRAPDEDGRPSSLVSVSRTAPASRGTALELWVKDRSRPGEHYTTIRFANVVPCSIVVRDDRGVEVGNVAGDTAGDVIDVGRRPLTARLGPGCDLANVVVGGSVTGVGGRALGPGDTRAVGSLTFQRPSAGRGAPADSVVITRADGVTGRPPAVSLRAIDRSRPGDAYTSIRFRAIGEDASASAASTDASASASGTDCVLSLTGNCVALVIHSGTPVRAPLCTRDPMYNDPRHRSVVRARFQVPEGAPTFAASDRACRDSEEFRRALEAYERAVAARPRDPGTPVSGCVAPGAACSVGGRPCCAPASGSWPLACAPLGEGADAATYCVMTRRDGGGSGPGRLIAGSPCTPGQCGIGQTSNPKLICPEGPRPACCLNYPDGHPGGSPDKCWDREHIPSDNPGAYQLAQTWWRINTFLTQASVWCTRYAEYVRSNPDAERFCGELRGTIDFQHRTLMQLFGL